VIVCRYRSHSQTLCCCGASRPVGKSLVGWVAGTTKTKTRQQLTLELYASAADGDRDSSAACHRTVRKCAGGLDCWKGCRGPDSTRACSQPSSRWWLLGPLLGCSEARVDMFGRQLLGKRFGGSASCRHIDSRDNGPGIFEDRVPGSFGDAQCWC
jgi:hypothetical protein